MQCQCMLALCVHYDALCLIHKITLMPIVEILAQYIVLSAIGCPCMKVSICVFWEIDANKFLDKICDYIITDMTEKRNKFSNFKLFPFIYGN
jgi:hypothetical protein